MNRFWDNAWTGIVCGFLALFLAVVILFWGIQIGQQAGWEKAITDQERNGAGMWFKATIDGRQYEGWLRKP